MLTVSFLKVESFAAKVSACAFLASRTKTMANNWANIILVLQKHELTSRPWPQSDWNGFTEKMSPYLDYRVSREWKLSQKMQKFSFFFCKLFLEISHFFNNWNKKKIINFAKILCSEAQHYKFHYIAIINFSSVFFRNIFDFFASKFLHFFFVKFCSFLKRTKCKTIFHFAENPRINRKYLVVKVNILIIETILVFL